MASSSILAIRLDSSFPNSVNTNLPPYECLIPLLNYLDQESCEQINKFRRLPDAQRCTLGRLLPRYLLTTKFGLKWSSIKFSKTRTGRPFTIHSDLQNNFDFNISHDSNWVVLGHIETHSRIGVDVMRVEIPWKDETVNEFIAGLADNLSKNEMNYLNSLPSDEARLVHVFGLWTLKEAYSKSLGIGLGARFDQFDFKFDINLEDKSKIVSAECYILGQKHKNWVFELRWLDDEHLLAIVTGKFRGNEKGSNSKITFVSLDAIIRVAEEVI